MHSIQTQFSLYSIIHCDILSHVTLRCNIRSDIDIVRVCVCVCVCVHLYGPTSGDNFMILTA